MPGCVRKFCQVSDCLPSPKDLMKNPSEDLVSQGEMPQILHCSLPLEILERCQRNAKVGVQEKSSLLPGFKSHLWEQSWRDITLRRPGARVESLPMEMVYFIILWEIDGNGFEVGLVLYEMLILRLIWMQSTSPCMEIAAALNLNGRLPLP